MCKPREVHGTSEVELLILRQDKEHDEQGREEQ